MFLRAFTGQRWFVIRVVGLLALVGLGLSLGCTNYSVQAPVEQRHIKASDARPAHYVVRIGDTVYGIAWRYHLDYKNIAAWNGLKIPYRIFPGQKLRLVKPIFVAQSQKAVINAEKKTLAAKEKSPVERQPQAIKKKILPLKSSKHQIIWQYPAKGKIIRSFKQTVRTGVDIAGEYGQKIRAAADGRVVYSGNGLPGYGKLIIIKHNDHFLTAYAHNSKLLASEGEEVGGGQVIAAMGEDTRTKRIILHFQIRRDGKPVDPLLYIPKV